MLADWCLWVSIGLRMKSLGVFVATMFKEEVETMLGPRA